MADSEYVFGGRFWNGRSARCGRERIWCWASAGPPSCFSPTTGNTLLHWENPGTLQAALLLSLQLCLWIEWLLHKYSCHMPNGCFPPVYSPVLIFPMPASARGLPRTGQILSQPSDTFLAQLCILSFCFLSPLWSPSCHSQCIFVKSLTYSSHLQKAKDTTINEGFAIGAQNLGNL